MKNDTANVFREILEENQQRVLWKLHELYIIYAYATAVRTFSMSRSIPAPNNLFDT